MYGEVIAETDSCIGLGMHRSNDFSYEQHARETAAKVAKLFGMVMKLFCTREPAFMARLYISKLRPILNYSTHVWSPSNICTQLERVQRKYTKRIKGM